MLAVLATHIRSSAAPNPPPRFAVEDVKVGIEQPIGMRFLPDGRMLLLQKKGIIQIVNVVAPGAPSEVYVDLAGPLHANGIDSNQERGLLDFAIDPNFPTDPYIYLFYTPATGPNGQRSRIARFTHLENAGGNSSRLDPASEVRLWEDTDGYDSCCHFGGGLDFGPDGNLWLTTGDHFQGSYAASLQKGGGKVHRIQKDGTIPPGNPFNDGAGPNFDSIFAYGLRNPFRARWDIPSGRLFIAEVGGNTQSIAWEDLHVIRYDIGSGRFIDADFGTPQDNGVFDGINFGWPDCEGLPPHTNFPNCNISAVAEPIFGYAHGGSFAAINGGVVYRGSLFPAEYQGAYFYADSTRDFVRYIRFNPDGSVAPNPDPDPIEPQNPDSISYPFDLSPIGRIVSIDVGPDGALYYISFTDSGGAYGQSDPTVLGSLRRYVYDNSNQRPVITQLSAVPVSGPSPLMVELTIEASDPEADAMTYVLHFGDGFDSGAPQPLPQDSPLTIAHTYATDGVYECTLEVFTADHTVAESVTVSIGTPPQITSIGTTNSREGATDGMFRYGDTITFHAEASDVEDGPLTGASFSWSISFMRPGNTHPAFGPETNVTAISFPVPEQGQGFSGPVFYRCFLTVTDSSGLTASTTIDIFPEKANITFDTVPSGIAVQVNGNTTETTPFTLDTLIGYPHIITVPDVRCVLGDEYTFNQWSNGETTSQITYIVPETNSALTATFNLTGTCELTPPEGGLVMHLKGTEGTILNGDTVQSWEDQTSNANDLAAVGSPTLLAQELNGKNVVHFDGIDDGLARTGFAGLPTGAGARSVFMVVRYNAANANGPAWAGFAYGTPANNQVFGVTLSPAGRLGVQGWGSAQDFETTAPGVGQWFSQSAVYTGSTLTQYKNNALLRTLNHAFATGTGRVRLGEELNGGKNLNMDVAEILVYDRAVSAVERQQIQDYLEQRYLLSNEANLPPTIEQFSAFPTSGTPPLDVEFQLTADDPENNSLTYLLSFGDGTATPAPVPLVPGETSVVQHTYAQPGAYQAQVTVSDGRAIVSTNVLVTIGAVPTITSLTSTNARAGANPNSFRFGDTLSFSATATDPEDGPLGGTNLTWSVAFHNENGVFPVVGPLTNTESINLSIQNQPQGFSGVCFYRCSLVVVDSSGLSTSSQIDVVPEKVNITVESIPSGIPIQLDGAAALSTPFTFDTLIGYEHQLAAPDETCFEDTQYTFTTWSNGELSGGITFTAPENPLTLNATYTAAGLCTSLPTEGLVMHLKTDAGIISNGATVTSWQDQSPLGNDLTAIGNPALLPGSLNGKDVVSFDGVDDAMSRVGVSGLPTGSAARSLFMVVRYNAVNTEGSGWAGFAYGTTSKNQVFGLALTLEGNLGVQGWGSSQDVATSTPAVGQWLSQGAVYSPGNLQQFSNNVLIDTRARTFNTGSGSIRLGEEINGGKNLNMEVAEIIVYNRVLSESERQQVQDYFDQRFSLTVGSAEPQLVITSPAPGAQFTSDQAIVLSGLASDAQEGDLSSEIVWNSDISGALGTGASIVLNNAAIGTHQITASVTDAESNQVVVTNTITVVDSQPVTPVSPIPIFTAGTLSGVYPYFSEDGFSDPSGVFTVTNGLLNVTGQKWGTLQTLQRYRDYKLVFEYRWGDRTWAPRETKARDGGVLFHSNGANNGWDGLLMPGYQVQVMEGSSGDLILLNGSDTLGNPLPLSMMVAAEQVECVFPTWNCAGGFRWNAVMPQFTMSTELDTLHWSQWDPAWQDTTGFRGTANVESPLGQWNQMVIVADGQNVSVYLNGQKINEATALGVTEGKIQLESEFAEYFVRRLEILPLNAHVGPMIILDGLSDGMIGQSYATTVSAYGIAAPLTWTVTSGSLPPGLTLVPETGVISGVPTEEGSFSFTIQVSDATGAFEEKEYQLSISPVLPPLPTSGLVLQLESDLNVALLSGDVVAGWLDQSGLGNDLTAAGDPRLIPGATPSGLPAIALDGINDNLNRVHASDPLGGLPIGNANRTMFVVSRFTGSTAWAGVSYGSPANNQTFGIVVKHPSGELVLQGYGKSHDLVTTASGIGAGWIVQTGVLNNGVGSIYKDGILARQWTHNYNTTLSRLVIGQEISNFGFVTMDIAALLIYDRALTQVEREDVENYLREKYLVAPASPAPPPALLASASTSRQSQWASEVSIRRIAGGEIEISCEGASVPGVYHLHIVSDLAMESLLDPGNRVQSITVTSEEAARGLRPTFVHTPETDTMFYQIVFDSAR